jgi:hypothetical protein
MTRWTAQRLRLGIVIMGLSLAAPAAAQFGGPPPPAGPAREIAPIDLVGQWVSIVTEDWRYRMVTPPPRDFEGNAPLTPAGRAIFDSWDPAADAAQGNACKAYGVGGIMRIPGRIRISWRDSSALEIQTDAGEQTRVLHFGALPNASAQPSWQGVSKAEWQLQRRGPAVVNGTLKVVTTGMREGYVRKGGVPYSANAVVTEYFDVLEQPDGSTWLVVKTIVDDPEYLTGQWIVTSNFRKQDNRSGWDPTPCAGG